MAQAVNASCQTCGPVQLMSTDISLFVFDNDKTRNHFAFVCPQCGVSARWKADDSTISKLVGIGVPVQRQHVPAEVLEEHPHGQQFTDDDVLDLMLEMDTWTGENFS